MKWIINLDSSAISAGKMNADTIGIDYGLMEVAGDQVRRRHRIRIGTIKILRDNQKWSSIEDGYAKRFIERFIIG